MRKISVTVRILPALLLAFIITHCSAQKTSTTGGSVGRTAESVSENGTTSFTVDGLQVIVKETPGNPVVASGFYLDGGTRYVPDRQAGIERFMLQASTEGTENYPKDQLNAELESMGTNISVAANYDFNGLQLNTLERNFDESWKIFQDVLLNPVFKEDDVEIVRQQLLTGLRSLQDDPDSYVAQVANNLFYSDTPYEVTLYGKEEVLENTTPGELENFHNEHVAKERALLIVVGDVDPNDIREKAKDLAAALPAESPEEVEDFTSFSPGESDLNVINRELPTTYIRGQFAAPSLGDPDYPAFNAAMRILDNKLFEEVRTKRNLSYAPAAGLSQRKQNYGLIYVSTAFPDTTIRVMFDTIDEMTGSPLPEQTLKNEISQSITRNLMQQETAQVQMNQLATYALVAGDYRLAGEYLEKLEQLSPEDIQTSMQQYVNNIHFGIVGDSSGIDKALFTRM